MLKYDPLAVFRTSTTPAGLYARNRWIGLEHDPAWRVDFDKTVSALRRGQLKNGGWADSPLLTINRLFGLHLTVREPDERINNALDWLTIMSNPSDPALCRVCGKEIIPPSFQDMPFVKGPVPDLLKAALLFLSVLFGRGREGAVMKQYDDLLKRFDPEIGRWRGMATTQNFLRALVVHPNYTVSKEVQSAVKSLGKLQGRSGLWKGGVNPYLMVNALGHLDMSDSDKQIKAAFRGLVHAQSRDGTWGRRHKEWNTFLVVHAINRKPSLL